jgi:hypothetical protein
MPVAGVYCTVGRALPAAKLKLCLFVGLEPMFCRQVSASKWCFTGEIRLSHAALILVHTPSSFGAAGEYTGGSGLRQTDLKLQPLWLTTSTL